VSATSTFVVPEASRQVVGAPTIIGDDVGVAWTRRFAECDTHDSVDGVSVPYKCSTDPNLNSVVLSLPNNVLFFDAKMGLDRDGSAHSRLRKGTDEAETSLRYPLPGSASLDADRVGYVVIPKGFLDRQHEVTPGDVAAVVYNNHLAFAVVGDVGLPYKIGEGSLRLHEVLGHDVCRTRSSSGDCVKALAASIGSNVLYFIFAGSAKEIVAGLRPDNINTRIADAGARHWEELFPKSQGGAKTQ
jgi:hypothetical protein